MEEYKELAGWILGTLGTIIALKKDWISAKLSGKKAELDVLSNAEKLEIAQMNNEEKRMEIYQNMLDDLTTRHTKSLEEIELRFSLEVDRLNLEVAKLHTLVKEQKDFIEKQSRSLRYYKDKYGDIVDTK